MTTDGGTMTAGSGFFINCNDDDTSAFTVSKFGATTILGTASGTDALTLTTGDITLVDGDVQQTTGHYLKSANIGITANVGSAQGNSPQTVELIEIAITGSGGDAITLPSAVVGKQMIIINRGANSADVFPASGDNINEAGANTAKALAADASLICVAIDSTHWECFVQARS